MKKLLGLALAGTAVATAMTGCGSKTDGEFKSYGIVHAGATTGMGAYGTAEVTVKDGIITAVNLDESYTKHGNVDTIGDTYKALSSEADIKLIDEIMNTDVKYVTFTATDNDTVCITETKTSGSDLLFADSAAADEASCGGTFLAEGESASFNNYLATNGSDEFELLDLAPFSWTEAGESHVVETKKFTKKETLGTNYEYFMPGYNPGAQGWEAGISIIENYVLGQKVSAITGKEGKDDIAGATLNDTNDYMQLIKAAIDQA